LTGADAWPGRLAPPAARFKIMKCRAFRPGPGGPEGPPRQLRDALIVIDQVGVL
jgi:hypothetical protein